MTVTKKLRDLIRTFQETHGRPPNVILIAPADEHALFDELPDTQKSVAFVDGVRAALPRFEGIAIRWGADLTSVDWEEHGPPFITG